MSEPDVSPMVWHDKSQRVPLKVWNATGRVPIEAEAIEQARNVCTLPFVFKHVALMPDAHHGKGSTIGSVIPTKGAIIPAAVGVDLGCGMMAVRLPIDGNDLGPLGVIRSAIERTVPHGRSDNGGASDQGAWREIPDEIQKVWPRNLGPRLERLVEKHPALGRANAVRHLSTLGTGNHFIEVCVDEEARVWTMLHTGSRGIGNRIGSHFIALAKREMERWFVHLPDADLAYLPEGSEHLADYVEAVSWAQDFALANRALMMARVLGAVLGPGAAEDGAAQLLVSDRAVNCHHNYVQMENHFGENVWVTRKGAVSARDGELGIIPGAMGRKSFVVRGRGNAESFHSCSHGAGRAMSRTAARKRFTVEDHVAATAGLECRKDADVIDETPAAYKSIDDVMAAQVDLVDVVHTLHAVVCVKG